MTYPTRDECVANATECIDRAFAEGRHGVVIFAQIADAPQVDFNITTWSGPWVPSRCVTTLSALLLPYLRICYEGIADSPLREADRIICEFAAAINEDEEHFH